MNSTFNKFLATVVVAAPLALASPASAAQIFGSDLTPTQTPSSLACSTSPCTVAQEYFDGYYNGYVRDSGVITQWKVKLNSGAQARLKTMSGTYEYTAKHTGPATTGNGGVSTVATRIPVEYGDYAGVELLSGSVQTDRYPAGSYVRDIRFQGAFADGETRRPTSDDTTHEIMSQVTVEPDWDNDGYGDETQDSCVFCNPGGGSSGGGGEVLPPASSGSGSGSSSGRGSGQTYAEMQSDYAARPLAKLSIDKRGFFEYRNGKPYLSLYYENQGRGDLEGSLALKWGKTVIPEINKGVNKRVSIDAGRDSSTSNFKLPKKLLKAITKKGSAKLTVTASMATEEGAKTSVKQTISVRRAGLTNAYDGYWKGTGGLVIQVSGGYLTSISVGLNAYCSANRKFMQRSLYTLGGYPLMINRNGTFAAKGSNSPDSIKYEGKLAKGGTAKGYLSLFHTKLELGSGGRLGIDQCFAASNWTAKRVRKG